MNLRRLFNPLVQRVGDDPQARRVLEEELKAFLGLSTQAHKYDHVRDECRERGENYTIEQIISECQRRMNHAD